ncbi:inositol-trisphosphate 3-kinase A [Myxocyprinus asiaticus]|uniref:inositol-trisphosphate 3-kinase A n=1 Tax=Myxocyprinus asiaticus TaxID=70543 RepID=UPI0022230739|nr:inositol-trisphosphate 3-kinase A [Myxocyprinus asiaticus]
MKDLDLPPGRMSMLSAKESNEGDVESVKDAVEETIFYFSSSSIKLNYNKKNVGFRVRPKLASAHTVLSSKLEEPTEMQTLEPEPPEHVCVDPLPMPAEEMTMDKDMEEKRVKERVMAGKPYVKEGLRMELNTATRKSLWRGKFELKERLKEGMQERLGRSLESIDEGNERELSENQRQRRISWVSKQRDAQTLGASTDGENSMDRSIEKEDKIDDREMKDCVPHPFLSRVLLHSSASSSSSFNSSAESDDVFSEGEDNTAARRKTMRRCQSWRTFLTIMQWSKCTPRSWIQLAGHQGNVKLSKGGEVLKRFCDVEDHCLQALMSDTLCQFVPHYFGHISQDGEQYIRLEDLLSGLKHPVIMDCKMGVRTYQEEEIIKARNNVSVRTDMYQKMLKADPAAPTAKEHAQRGVTKLRYLQWRDDSSTTSTLGFRIEGIVMGNGKVLRNFYKTHTEAQVTETLLSFTRSQVHVLKAYKSRLQALNETLKQSMFFSKHEIIGSSLLFVHDSSSKANIWMIDFGKTIPTPEDVHLRHDLPWVEGNREDGYLIGLNSLISLLGEAIRQAEEQSQEQPL